MNAVSSLFPQSVTITPACSAVVGRATWFAGHDASHARNFGLSSQMLASLNNTIARGEVLDEPQAASAFQATVAFEDRLLVEYPFATIDETLFSLLSVAGPRRVATDVFMGVREFDAQRALVERLEEITGVRRDMLAARFSLVNFLPDAAERSVVAQQFGSLAARTMWEAALEAMPPQ